MKTMEKETIAETMLNGLKKAIIEIEEFRVQAALGKMEAKDMYVQLKKDLGSKLHEIRSKTNELSNEFKEKAIELKALFESLQVQLALGKAETKELFEEELKAIHHTLDKIENLLKNDPRLSEYYTKLHNEIHKFRIKTDILKLRFELKKIDISEEFVSRKNELMKVIDELKNKFVKEPSKLEHMKDELGKAYSHIRKAFV